MVELGIDYFPGIDVLLREEGLAVHYVKMGPYLEGVADEAIAQAGDRGILYHHGNAIVPSGGNAEAVAVTLRRWQQRTHCPWLSVHLNCYADADLRAFFREGRPLPHYDTDQALELVCRAVRGIQDQVAGRLLLENVDYWPSLPTNVATLASSISRVVTETQCDLLLDIAHARVTAAALDCDVHSYLEQLPLGRTVEIHVSGPRVVNGRLLDRHEPMLDEDYALLRWVLQRTDPQVVTLEYGKDAAKARNQLLGLQSLLAGA